MNPSNSSSSFLLSSGIGGTYSAQRPSQWFAVPEEPVGDSVEYLLLVKNPRCGRGAWLLPEPLPLQRPGDKGAGGQHPPGNQIYCFLAGIKAIHWFYTASQLMILTPLVLQFMGQFHDKLHQVLKNLLQRSGETRHLLLSWLGSCLQANAGRAKIWANQMPEIFFQMYASDAFFLNLGAALLKLCQPFCRPRSPKLLTFNPTYCALKELSEEERRNRNVHARG